MYVYRLIALSQFWTNPNYTESVVTGKAAVKMVKRDDEQTP